jgi:hypothetical protein
MHRPLIGKTSHGMAWSKGMNFLLVLTLNSESPSSNICSTASFYSAISFPATFLECRRLTCKEVREPVSRPYLLRLPIQTRLLPNKIPQPVHIRWTFRLPATTRPDNQISMGIVARREFSTYSSKFLAAFVAAKELSFFALFAVNTRRVC